MLNIALLQMTSCGLEQEANLAKGAEFCRRARSIGADIALFPEMWNIVYTDCLADVEGQETWRAQATAAWCG